MTNSLHFIVDNLYGLRWLYFEDTPKEIIKHYFIGILFWTLFPILIGLSCILDNEHIDTVKPISIIIFVIAIIIGSVKTFFDTINYIKLTSKYSKT